ncbi:MAG TPA: hypothetical protein VKZ63_06120 [Kofleriaceae bacterium]|nr:hypothetical protein [Kofleriaceae bacterium]
MGDGRGVIAITPDKELGKTLRIALTAAGAEARTVRSLGELPRPIDASLVVLHQVEPDEKTVAEIARHLSNGTQMIVLLPRGDLAATVAALRSHDRVAGVLNADRIRTQEVTAMATRLLFGDIFGLDKVLPWGARIHSMSVGSYDDKTAAIERISEFATSIGVRRKYRESIEQCCDEMLMNALYDAPVDEDGRPLTHKRPGRGRPPLAEQDRAVIEYGCDGQRFAVAVRDRFGRFERSVLIRYLDKCLHSAQQIDQKVGGAGLGLYLMSNSATSLMFNILPGVVTECVCTFDIGAAKVELEQLGVFRELVDDQGRLIGGPERVGPFPVERRRRPQATPAAVLASGAAEETAAAAPAAEGKSPVGGGLSFALAIAVLLICGGIAAMIIPRAFGGGSEPAAAAPGAGEAEPSPPSPVPATAPLPSGSLTVRANVPGFITVDGNPQCYSRPLPLEGCALPDGRHHVHIYGDDPLVEHSFWVEIAGTDVVRELEFALVEARPGYLLVSADYGPSIRRVAFLGDGTHELEIVGEDTGKRRKLTVPVHEGQTVLVP